MLRSNSSRYLLLLLLLLLQLSLSLPHPDCLHFPHAFDTTELYMETLGAHEQFIKVVTLLPRLYVQLSLSLPI